MILPLVALLAAAAPGDAAALRAQATADYRAKRYADACPKYAAAAKLAPDDGALAADLGLCLHRLGKKEEAIAATQRAVALARPGTVDAARIRSGAYFNLAMMGEALSPPKVDGCLALPPPPGCARPLHACAYAASSYGTGGGLKTSFLVVARTAGAARIQGERTEGSVLYDVDPPGALPDAESREPESVAAEVYGVLPLAEEQEMFVGRCYEFAERACTEDEAAGAAVEACLKARGCAGGAGCDAWDACVDTSCPADVKARVAESQKACDAQAAALTHARCRLVAADACAGVAATVCEDAEGRSRRRAVHEVVLAP